MPRQFHLISPSSILKFKCIISSHLTISSLHLLPSGQNVCVVFSRKAVEDIVKQSMATWYEGAVKTYDYTAENPEQVCTGYRYEGDKQK